MQKLTLLDHNGSLATALSVTTIVFGSVALDMQQANAAAVIFNTGDATTGNIALGINDEGHLNVTDPFGAVSTANASGYFGVAAKFADGSWQDATAPGCLCEGWGVSGTLATSGTSHSGFANVDTDFGVNNLGLIGSGFVTDASAGVGSFATSNVSLLDIALEVTQDYRTAANTPDLFENRVTITNNTGEDINDLRYVRVIDWDVPPTEFNEFVTILGTTSTTFLERSHDGGFSSADPLGFDFPENPATEDVDLIDDGPADHGAYFRFNFGTLAAGESREFSVFYGVSVSESAANLAIATEEIELLTYGQQSGDPNGGRPVTYIFGFKGVGGTPVIPQSVPEPISALGLLLGTALGLVAMHKHSSSLSK